MLSLRQRSLRTSNILRQLADDPGRVALLLIDVQNQFTSSGVRSTRKIPKLADAFREAGGQVYAIHYFALNNREEIDFCFYKPDPEDIVIQKSRPSAFKEKVSISAPHDTIYHQDSMEALLRDNGHTHILSCGYAFRCCVFETSYDAADLGFDTTLVKDLTDFSRGVTYAPGYKDYISASIGFTTSRKVMRALKP